MSKKHLAILALTALALSGCGALSILDRPVAPYTGKAKFIVLPDSTATDQYEALKADGWQLAAPVDTPTGHDYYVLTKEGR